MGFIDTIKARAKADKKVIVLPETEDRRTYEATAQILKEGIADVVLVGSEEAIKKGSEGLDISGAKIVDPATSEKTQGYIDKLNALNFKEMYNGDFFLTWEKTDDEIEAVFTVADALRYMRENNISTKVFESGLGISLFRDNSTRTRFSFASACNLLGLEVQDLDEGKSQVAHGETVRETANMISFMADVIGIRDDMYIGKGNKYMHEVVDAVTEGNKDGILEQ